LSLPTRTDQIASFHQPIAPNGLYWTSPIPPSALRVERDEQLIRVDVHDLAIIDQPKAPFEGPTYDAVVSLRVTWRADGFPVGFTDPAAQFRLEFRPAEASIAFQASVPSLGFRFASEPASSSESIFAIVGHEQNGVFF